MSRIQGVGPERANWLVRLIYFFSRQKLGKVPVPAQVAAHQPRLLFSVGMMEMGQEGLTALPRALKVLVQVQVGRRIGCPF